MKKVFMALVAMFALSTVAEAQITVGLASYDGKYFTCQYPDDFEADDDPIIASMFEAVKDDQHKMQISINDVTKSAQEFKEWVDYQKAIYSTSEYWKADAPVCKGQTMTMRRVLIKNEDPDAENVKMVAYDFAAVSPKSKKLFTGEIHFPLSEESTYKPLIDRIVASLKEK